MEYSVMAYRCPLATEINPGIVIPGTNLIVDNGTMSVSAVALLDQAYFYSTVIQTNPVASTVNLMTFNNSGVNVGITLVAGTQITVSKTANYNFQFSAQVDKTDVGVDEIDIWILRNTLNYPGTNTALSLSSANIPLLAAWNYTLALAAGDFVEIAWQSLDVNMRLLSNPAQVAPSRPATPSVRCTIVQL
jgi:hypothetical protein